MKRYNKELNERYKRLRIAAGVTQTEIAMMLNVSQSMVSGWDNGRTIPERYIKDVSKMLKISPDTLLNFGSSDRDSIIKDITIIMNRLSDDDLKLLKAIVERIDMQ